MYEGYGPGGVAILVEATTDNRNRTASEMRFILPVMEVPWERRLRLLDLRKERGYLYSLSS